MAQRAAQGHHFRSQDSAQGGDDMNDSGRVFAPHSYTATTLAGGVGENGALNGTISSSSSSSSRRTIEGSFGHAHPTVAKQERQPIPPNGRRGLLRRLSKTSITSRHYDEFLNLLTLAVRQAIPPSEFSCYGPTQAKRTCYYRNVYAYHGRVFYVRASGAAPVPEDVEIHSERGLFVQDTDVAWLTVATYDDLAAMFLDPTHGILRLSSSLSPQLSAVR